MCSFWDDIVFLTAKWQEGRNTYLMCLFWMWYYFFWLQYGIILLGINSDRLCVCSEDVIISSSRIEFVCIVLFGSICGTELFFNSFPDAYDRNMFPLCVLYSPFSFDLHYSKKNNLLPPSFMKCWVPFLSSFPIRKFAFGLLLQICWKINKVRVGCLLLPLGWSILVGFEQIHYFEGSVHSSPLKSLN